MQRREFITLLGAAAGWPLAARAQRPSKIGVLSGLPENDPEGHARIAAFREALQNVSRFLNSDSNIAHFDRFCQHLWADRIMLFFNGLENSHSPEGIDM